MVEFECGVLAPLTHTHSITHSTKSQTQVQRRMAQFKALHAGLRYEILDAPKSTSLLLAPFDTDAHRERRRNRRNGAAAPELPAFPSSSWGRSFSNSYIQETKEKLNRYVRSLLNDSKLLEDGIGESVALRMFVREQRPGGYGTPRRRVGCWSGDDGRLHLGLVLERKTEGGHWLSPKERLALQSNKCAGCRKDIEISVFGKETCRFCDYTSFLFCTTCHQNDRAVIPARVLHQWNFTEGRVSRAAKEYLNRLAKQPALCVSAINPTLFTEKLPLHHARLLRVRCFFFFRVQYLKIHNMTYRNKYRYNSDIFRISVRHALVRCKHYVDFSDLVCT